MSILSFTATPYNKGVLLSWNPGGGSGSSTSAGKCEITVQYSTSDIPNVVPNTPPYVVRQLQQGQHTRNFLWHPHLVNGTSYIYTMYVHYLDTGYWTDPHVVGPVIPALGLGSPFVSGSISFSKLGTNTRLSNVQDSSVEIVVWLPLSQNSRKTIIEEVLRKIAPAHVRINVVYEPYYIAQTTTDQFTACTYDSTVYTINNGTIKNSAATIDNSFSGQFSIFGGE